MPWGNSANVDACLNSTNKFSIPVKLPPPITSTPNLSSLKFWGFGIIHQCLISLQL